MQKKSLFIITCLGLLFHSRIEAQQNVNPQNQGVIRAGEGVKTPSIPHLTGDEILCEIETDAYNGIFAVDTKKQMPLPTPIVENGHSPKWAPKHTVFSFFRGGVIWVGDCQGHIQSVALIPRYAENFKLEWDSSGRAYVIYGVPGWTRLFARGLDLKEDFAQKRLSEGKPVHLRMAEQIIMKSDVASKERTIEVETEYKGKRIKEQMFLAPNVKSTGAVAFSPNNKSFVMQVGEDLPYGSMPSSHLWLFKTIDSNVNDPDYSQEAFLKKINENDYSRFYDGPSVIPKATFVKELTGQNKEVFEVHPTWSPDGKMLAYTQVNVGKQEVWPHILTGANLENDVVISIPDYLPFETERWAKKSVEVLSWEPDGTLFLIEGTKDKIYQVKKTEKGFEASLLIDITAGGRPNFMYPVFHKEWVAYVLSIDDFSGIHLKNYKTGEERLLKLALSGRANGLIKSLNW